MLLRTGQPTSRLELRCAKAFVWAAIPMLLAASAGAQQWETDLGEASISTGLALGATGTSVDVTGAIGTSLDRYLSLTIEGGYIPMGDDLFVRYPGAVANGSGLYHFDIALHIRVPLRRRWEPYGILGPALLYNHYQLQAVHPNGTAYYFGASDVRGGALVGGGVRYYREEYWGIQGEFRYTISSRNFGSLLVGVFREF